MSNIKPHKIRDEFDEFVLPEIRKVLPPSIPEDRFARIALTALSQNPDLIKADQRSLFNSMMQLAQDGLLPDGREAALVVFNTRDGDNWKKVVQPMVMIRGLLKQIRLSGEVAKLNSQVVYENDDFVVSYGFDENINHTAPPLGSPRGKPVGVYAAAVLNSGEHLIEVMDCAQVDEIRKRSRSPNKGPWVTDWGEMARKTVTRRLAKRLPMASDKIDTEDAAEKLDVPEQIEAEAKIVDRTTKLSADMLAPPVQESAPEPEQEPEPEPEPEQEVLLPETKTAGLNEVLARIGRIRSQSGVEAARRDWPAQKATGKYSVEDARLINDAIAEAARRVSAAQEESAQAEGEGE